MTENEKQIKLFGQRQAILVVVALCAGLGLSCYVLYSRKGYLDAGDLVAMVIAGVLFISIVGLMAWYANKPEREE